MPKTFNLSLTVDEIDAVINELNLQLEHCDEWQDVPENYERDIRNAIEKLYAAKGVK